MAINMLIMRFTLIGYWMGYDFLTTHQPKKILVKFDKEVEYGQEVESHYEIVEQENQLKTRHEIRIDGQTYCEANIDWTN